MPDILTKSNNPNQIAPSDPVPENYDAEVEMFTDQLANLLWQQWMYKREADNRSEKLKLNSDAGL